MTFFDGRARFFFARLVIGHRLALPSPAPTFAHNLQLQLAF